MCVTIFLGNIDHCGLRRCTPTLWLQLLRFFLIDRHLLNFIIEVSSGGEGTMLSSVFTFPVLCMLVLTAVHLSVSQLTDEQKQDLLDQHNRARSMVDPIATNMEEMVSH